jgi:hypothetical protein
MASASSSQPNTHIAAMPSKAAPRSAANVSSQSMSPLPAGLPRREPRRREYRRRLRGRRAHPDYPVHEAAKPRSVQVSSSDQKQAVTA